MKTRLLGLVAVALVVACAIVVVQNVALGLAFPHLARVATDFSPAYLRRELTAVASGPPTVVFLGDSVLWGYKLPTDETAIAILTKRGCVCRNFAFKSGSPPNAYALALLFSKYRVRPKAVVMEINQKVFNAADPSYNTLHPAIAALARPLMSRDDLAALASPAPSSPAAAFLDDVGSRVSTLYAMRADIRALIFGETSDAPAGPITADAFLGTYDLTPLTTANAGVRFTAEAVAHLHSAGVPVIAFMTPANHRLLHDYIDSEPYRANGAYLRRLLERNGARVVDLDAAFQADEFIDNDHLNAAGQHHLASVLAAWLPR